LRRHRPSSSMVRIFRKISGTLQIPVDTFSATPGGARVAIES